MIVLKVLWSLVIMLKLRFKLPKRFIKFGIVGFSGVIINEGLLYFFTEIVGFYYLISSIIAIESSMINNFLLNDIWTFRDRKKSGKGPFFKRFIHWHFARGITLLINFLILWGLTTFGLHYLISNIIGILVAMSLGYFWSLNWIWKNR